jgi:hypothetical protein
MNSVGRSYIGDEKICPREVSEARKARMRAVEDGDLNSIP